MDRLRPEARPILNILASTATSNEISIPVQVDPLERERYDSVGYLRDGIEEAMTWAKDAINNSLARLQKPETADMFVAFINTLVNGAHSRLAEYADQSGVQSTVLITLAKKDISKQIYNILQPIYRVLNIDH